jgi:hypothetical protein
MANTNDRSGKDSTASEPLAAAERLNRGESFEIARAGGNMEWITKKAPYYDVQGPVWNNPDPVALKPGQEPPKNIKDLGDKKVDYRPDAQIQIGVEPLPRSSLGLLNNDNVRAVYQQAVEKKAVDDLRHYGKTPQQILEIAVNTKYFESPAHMAWSEAASARTNGKITPEQWRRLDPIGGTNGNGPEILPGGKYPHELSKIGMGHDTDWSLGRYFNAGPMEKLYEAKATTKEELKDIGGYGLVVGNSSLGRPPKGYYDNSHPDWSVVYLPGPDRKMKASLDDGTAIAAVPNVDNGPSARIANAKVGDELRWNGDRTNLDYAFNIDGKPKPSIGEALQNTIDSRQFNIGGNQVQNPYADRFAGFMKELESPNFGIDKQKDNAAALVEATMQFKQNEGIQAMLGSKENLIAMQGSGDSANRVSVDIGKTDGAFQRVSDAVVAQATQQSQTTAGPAPNQEPEQRKQASPTIV